VFAVSLDEVAAHAGFTKGAIYGNFKSKDDLVFALTIERTSRGIPLFTAGTPVKEQLHTMVRRSFGGTPKGRKHFAFLAELELYAFTHEALSRRFMKFARERHEQSATFVSQQAVDGKLALSPLQFVIVVYAMVNGLLFQHACYPDIVTEEVAVKALDALID
jgi:AcrR family transcriptional regulator